MLEHTVAVAVVIVAVGKAITAMVTDPVCGWLQLGVPAEVTSTNVKVVSAVNADVVTVTVPVASNTAVWLAAPLL